MTDNINRQAFRKEIRYDQEQGFDRNLQLQMCAGQLEALREAVGQRWIKLGSPQEPFPGAPELKLLVKNLIRKCSESTDFYATVDFITRRAYEILDAQRGNRERGLKKHLKHWDELSHEHMVPGAVVFDTLIKCSNTKFFPILEPLSYRALVHGTKRKRKLTSNILTDISQVDGEFSSSLPPISRLPQFSTFDIKTLPLKFWGLLRYDAAGLLPDLIPISGRARRTLREYKLFKAERYKNSETLDTLERLRKGAP